MGSELENALQTSDTCCQGIHLIFSTMFLQSGLLTAFIMPCAESLVQNAPHASLMCQIGVCNQIGNGVTFSLPHYSEVTLYYL